MNPLVSDVCFWPKADIASGELDAGLWAEAEDKSFPLYPKLLTLSDVAAGLFEAS